MFETGRLAPATGETRDGALDDWTEGVVVDGGGPVPILLWVGWGEASVGTRYFGAPKEVFRRSPGHVRMGSKGVPACRGTRTGVWGSNAGAFFLGPRILTTKGSGVGAGNDSTPQIGGAPPTSPSLCMREASLVYFGAAT